jgi:hypothetical protein
LEDEGVQQQEVEVGLTNCHLHPEDYEVVNEQVVVVVVVAAAETLAL